MSSESLTRTDYGAYCGDNLTATHSSRWGMYLIGCRRCGTTTEMVDDVDVAVGLLPQEHWKRLQRLLERGGGAREQDAERTGDQG